MGWVYWTGFKAKNGINCDDLMLKTVLIIIVLKIKQYEKDAKIFYHNFGNGDIFPSVRKEI